jgi:hypothetical protein
MNSPTADYAMSLLQSKNGLGTTELGDSLFWASAQLIGS